MTGRDHLEFEVLTTVGDRVAVQIRVHPLVVEVWRGCLRRAVFNRKELGIWLRDPHSPIRVNDVAFSLDRLGTGRIAIAMTDVPCRPLSPEVARALDANPDLGTNL